jgi:hypothetical protein
LRRRAATVEICFLNHNSTYLVEPMVWLEGS